MKFFKHLVLATTLLMLATSAFAGFQYRCVCNKYMTNSTVCISGSDPKPACKKEVCERYWSGYQDAAGSFYTGQRC